MFTVSLDTLDALQLPAIAVLIAVAVAGWWPRGRDKSALPLATRIVGRWRMRRAYRGLDRRWGARERAGRAGKVIGGGL